jgi:hypothetical protein
LRVIEQLTDIEPDADPSASTELFLIQTRPNRTVLFMSPETVRACEVMEADHVWRFIQRLVDNRNAVIRWIGRVSRAGHEYYQRLEDKIDPLERIIKAIHRPHRLSVRHSQGADAQERLRRLLSRQKRKHLAWLVVDGTITVVVALLAPVLVPIPGPNLLFYYPVLRLLSHYRAVNGASRGLGGTRLTFDPLPALDGLEKSLGISRTPRSVREAAAGMKIEGLGKFLEGMV